MFKGNYPRDSGAWILPLRSILPEETTRGIPSVSIPLLRNILKEMCTRCQGNWCKDQGCYRRFKNINMFLRGNLIKTPLVLMNTCCCLEGEYDNINLLAVGNITWPRVVTFWSQPCLFWWTVAEHDVSVDWAMGGAWNNLAYRGQILGESTDFLFFQT